MQPSKSVATDMAGRRYGRWTVFERAGSKHGMATWLCRCDCGQEANVFGNNLRSGKSKGCRSCASREKATTHGGTGTRLHNIWFNMRQRCGNKNHHGYKNYGGRGIRVCAEWDESFGPFRAWAMANGYKSDLSIDRINNDGNYEPGNCRWATSRQQQRNARSNVHVTINGVTKLICEWAEIAGIEYATLLHRVDRGWRGERLLSPSTRRNK